MSPESPPAQEGSIDADTWSGFRSLLEETTRYPGVRQWFAARRTWFSTRFQDYVDELIRDNPPVEDYLFEDEDDPGCEAAEGLSWRPNPLPMSRHHLTRIRPRMVGWYSQ